MNRRSILTKTGKGLMEATGKTSNLSRDLRNILKEIDGKVSVSELLDKFDKVTEQKLLESLASMERDGYVREFIGKQDEGPRTPVGRSSGPPSLGAGSDLDFTAFTPAKPNAKANEDARLSAQAQEIARQAQVTRAREEAAAKARADAAASARAKGEAEAAARAKADAEQRSKQAAVTKTGAHTPLPPLINPTVIPPPSAPPVVGILGAGAEAQARAQADAQARTQAADLERARREAEEKARREAEQRTRREAEERAKAEIEAAIKREADERALREIQERTRREAEERARREAEARAKLEAEQRVRREAEERTRRELEERTRREVAERLRREEEERRRREEEERARREAERQARIEAETKARVDAELRAKREAEERVRREEEERRQAEIRKRAEGEQRKRQEAEQAAALERALKEEQEKAQREAEESAERKEQERREQESEEPEREEPESHEREEPILEDDLEEERQREEERYAREEAKRAREEERAAAKAAAKMRKAERSRERAGEEAWRGDEDALRDSGPGLSAREVWEKRKPRSFLKTLGMMLVMLVIVGVAALPFVPLETAQYEKSATAWLGLPVKIGSLNVTYFPLPQLKFEKVLIGGDPQMRAAVIKASPDLGTLLDDRVTLNSLAMENVTVPKQFLAALLQDRAGSRGLGVRRITAKGLKVDAPELDLPGLELEATLSADGSLKSASLSNGGQLSVSVEPHGGKAAIEITAATLPIPIGVDFGLSDFSAKGTATAGELALSNVEGRAFGGRILGTARLRWSSGWNLDADLSARQMDAVKIAGPLLGAGTVVGKGRISMRGLLPERLVLNYQLDGNFSVQKGSISNVDMPRLLQGSGSGGGTTIFSELSGDFSADPNRLLVRNIRLAAGLLSGQGQIEMDPQRNLSGRMQIELRATSVQARSTLGVSGTLNNPQFRRTN